ncbi:MAG: 2,3-bisphosphoglycerate-independent phosphoglycerate mutase [Natronospirillum sp.]|uniref:2,3-bisphosphoglycerate-independent phosphoglycerate mutase n=1 Tax=Natronospirillum sp. TaxID=2812955 RepID=UPI0025F32CF7|nr:2,3-bisphosphoglycerate-independent phosphoglycerate mutase [Natronospirillum sp.]MCH8550784.1 2,3-bisphosphoglycerate-independent phosphoglycerate mutase [Natronospirillum sp.]
MSAANQSAQKKTVALIILDGFGYSETSQSNAIREANTPTWDRLWKDYPHNLVKTSGLAVGLPEGQMGNSEVGHMNLGAGRIVYQSFTRVSKDIEDGHFAHNEALVHAVESAKKAGGKVHILGLASPGGVHSHEDHLIAMIDLAAARGVDVCVHAFLDGRDTPPRSAEATLKKLQEHSKAKGVSGVVSLIGRYYAMDRDNRWERVQQAYDLLTQGKAEIVAADPVAGLHTAYEQDKDDEFVPPTSIRSGDDAAVMADGDSAVFMNFRPDRARELTRAFVDDGLDSDLDRSVRPALSDFVTLTEYAADIKASCAYPPTPLKNTLGEYLADKGKTQLRIAETEKYAHVTFFFNGGEEKQYAGEDRELVPSPRVATYDLQPEMSAPEVTEKLAAAIRSGKYDLVVCNYANGDMVGHTGKMDAAIKAVETLDWALAEVTQAILDVDGQCLITADHGNVELMVDPKTGGAVTSHTVFPVPLVYVSNNRQKALKEGRLCDIAPTLLYMLGETQPEEMTGDNLLG